MMYETQPQELWRSSRDLMSVRSDKEEPSSRSSGVSKKINKTGAVQYLHSQEAGEGEREPMKCSSMVVQRVEAPLSVVWSLVRRFDEPQIYKQFVRNCSIRGEGDLKVKVGCLREVQVVSGLPAATSTERLDILDEEQHILSFSIVGGDHRLNNYRSITNLQETLINGKPGTTVIESYVVDVPHGNTKEETSLFVDTIVKSNLQSLAHVSQHLITAQRC
jgi:abscisic acid receptor (PYR/PYL family)